MEVKVTLEAGQSLIDLVNTLLQGLSRQTIAPVSVPTEKKSKKQPKPGPAPQPELIPEPTAEPTAEPELETTEAPAEELQINDTARPEIDYAKLRAEIKTIASNKVAADPESGKSRVRAVFEKYGCTSLSKIADADLPAVKAEIEAL